MCSISAILCRRCQPASAAQQVELVHHPSISNPNASVSNPNSSVSNPNSSVSNPNCSVSNPNPSVSNPNPSVSNPNCSVSNPNSSPPDGCGLPGYHCCWFNTSEKCNVVKFRQSSALCARSDRAACRYLTYSRFWILFM